MQYITTHFLYNNGITELFLDINAQLLTVGVEDTALCAYFLANPQGIISARPCKFYVTCSNTVMPPGDYTYINTLCIQNVVYHVFEVDD